MHPTTPRIARLALPLLLAVLAPRAVLVGDGGAPAPGADAPAQRHVATANSPTYTLQDGLLQVQVLLDHESVGPTDAALSLLVAHPGAAAPDHTHEGAELVYVLEGRADMTLDGQPISVGPGDAVHVPAGVSHTFTVPPGGPPLKAVQVYVPGGPEQRFKKGLRSDPDPAG